MYLVSGIGKISTKNMSVEFGFSDMSLSPPPRVALLLLALGIALLWVGPIGNPPETGTVSQYTAYEIDHDGDELVLTEVPSGERRAGDRVSSVNVDDRIVCLPAHTRECDFERQSLEGDLEARGIGSEFRYVYLDDEFYRITSANVSHYEHERTDPSDALADLAVDSGSLHEEEREAIDEGRIISTHEFTHANRIVERGGSYYTILRTGQKSYSAGGSFCSSSGDDFCREADHHRWGLWLRSGGVGLLGLLGVVVGGRRLFEGWKRGRDSS